MRKHSSSKESPTKRRAQRIKSSKNSTKRCESHDLRGLKRETPKETTEISLANPLFIMELARTEPNLAASHAKSAVSSLNSGFNHRKHQLLGSAVGIAYNLQAVRGEWRLFCKHPFWDSFKRRPKNSARSRNKALPYVMRFIFDAKSQNEINVTNRYAKMLEIEYNTSVNPEDIADIIQSYGGIEKMRRARVQVREEDRRKARRRKAEAAIKDLDDLDDKETGDPVDVHTASSKSAQSNKTMTELDIFYAAAKKYLANRRAA